MLNPQIKQELLTDMRGALEYSDGSAGNVEERWGFIKGAICDSTRRVLGPNKRTINDWFEQNIEVLHPVIEEKRKAFLSYKRSPTSANLDKLKHARSASQRASRDCANKYWLDLCSQIQRDADVGNIRGMYEGMRKAFGPSVTKRAPIKSKEGRILKTRCEQMDRWVEHYSDVYSNRFIIGEDTLAEITQIPTLYELDAIPTREELDAAIGAASAGKSPGQDGIAVETVKHCREVLLDPLHDLLVVYWETGELPQNFKDSKIVTLYKSKGDRSNCDNYRGISLLSVIGKIFLLWLNCRKSVGSSVNPYMWPLLT